jgi:hypothetical protein
LKATVGFFPKAYIYTDTEGKAYIENHILDAQLLGKVEIILFDFSGNWNKNYWNYPKLMVYNAQTEPFLHLDLDLILLQKPSDWLLNAPLLCEKTRGLAQLSRARAFLPEVIQKHFHPIIPCSGAYGGNALQLFKKLYQVAQYSCTGTGSVSFEMMYTVEEVAMASILKINEIEPHALLKDSFIHHQGERAKKQLSTEDTFSDLDFTI